MKRVFTVIAFLCAVILDPEYARGQYMIDFKDLISTATKEKVNERGEAFERIEGSTENFDMSGTLRIVKTNNVNEFNYVHVGRWIYNGKHPTMSGMGKVHFTDTTFYDSLGNATSRVYYSGKNGEFALEKRQTLEKRDGQVVQHTQYYGDDHKPRKSYYEPVTDFNVPRNWNDKIVPR